LVVTLAPSGVVGFVQNWRLFPLLRRLRRRALAE
jgi:hypothetical protein